VTKWHQSNLTKAEFDNLKSQFVISSWELIHNPNFNYGRFAIIKNQAGLNSFSLTPQRWIETTNAKSGRNKNY
jgi:hypothetical protein